MSGLSNLGTEKIATKFNALEGLSYPTAAIRADDINFSLGYDFKL